MDVKCPEWPTVTVIVATHQRPKLLKRALASVARQTFRDFEVIVIHDGPANKETVKVCDNAAKGLERKGVHLRLLATSEESGYYTLPRNWATMHARGDYIANLDDDNEWTPEHLQVLVEAIEEGEEWPDFVYSRRKYVTDPGGPKMFGGVPMPRGSSPLVPWDEQAKERLASSVMNNFIDSGDFLVGRGCYYNLAVQTGMMWNEGYRRFGDYELLCRAVFFGGWRGKAVDRVTHIYHWHTSNVSTTRPPQELPQEMRL